MPRRSARSNEVYPTTVRAIPGDFEFGRGAEVRGHVRSAAWAYTKAAAAFHELAEVNPLAQVDELYCLFGYARSLAETAANGWQYDGDIRRDLDAAYGKIAELVPPVINDPELFEEFARTAERAAPPWLETEIGTHDADALRRQLVMDFREPDGWRYWTVSFR